MNNGKFGNQLLRIDQRLAEVDWPQPYKVEVPLVEISDCLVICAGVETRSIGTLRRIRDAGKSGFTFGLISYFPEQPGNKEQELRTISRDAALQVKSFIYDRGNPSGMGEELKDFTQGFERVFIDITGMSNLLIVQTLVALIGAQNQQLSILYGEAKEYPPSKEEFQQNHNIVEPVFGHLSSGIFEIALTPELSSVAMLGQPLRLVAFPTFDASQLTNLLYELQPTYVELIHGIPPSKENDWRTEAIRSHNLPSLHGLQRIDDEHKTSTFDYRETLHKLLAIYAERSMFDRIVISPTGSKMQSLAVGLFRAALHDIQIVYPTPRVFAAPEKYTLGLRELYQLDLPTEVFIGNNKNLRGDFVDSQQDTSQSCERTLCSVSC